jgi:hypothetical protein
VAEWLLRPIRSSAPTTDFLAPTGIQWNTVDWGIYAPVIAQQLPATLADKSELLAKLIS